MGTRSTIGIQNEDGTVTGIYCHWDGYIEHNGTILFENYTDEDKVLALIALGDLSTLGPRVVAEGAHSYDHPEKGVSVAYARDRGETGTEARTFNNAAHFYRSGEEFDYLFIPGQGWQVHIESNNTVVDLQEAMNAAVK